MCCYSPFFTPHPLSLSSSPLPPFFTPLYSLFPPQSPSVFHLPPPPLSLSPTIFTPHFSHPNLHQFSPPSHSLSTPTSFHSPPTLSPTIFTPPYSLFSHPHPHQFSPPSHSLSLPPLPPFFTTLPLPLSPPPLVLTFLPLSLLPPPLWYPPNCQYTLAYRLNDLCTEVSAEFK